MTTASSTFDDPAARCRCVLHRPLRRAEVLRAVARRYREQATTAPPSTAGVLRGEAGVMEAEARQMEERAHLAAAGRQAPATCTEPAA